MVKFAVPEVKVAANFGPPISICPPKFVVLQTQCLCEKDPVVADADVNRQRVELGWLNRGDVRTAGYVAGYGRVARPSTCPPRRRRLGADRASRGDVGTAPGRTTPGAFSGTIVAPLPPLFTNPTERRQLNQKHAQSISFDIAYDSF